MELQEKPNETIQTMPSKSFFIDVLPRDIGLADCILDLVDNAIDSFVRHSNIDVMNILLENSPPRIGAENSTASIIISFSENSFSIRDTCGGITIQEAKDYVFKFGLPEEKTKSYSGRGLSVFGIGMKRAFFKIGRLIKLLNYA